MRDAMRNTTHRGTGCMHIIIVIITDGQSNDPFLDVCDEITCLRNNFFFPMLR